MDVTTAKLTEAEVTVYNRIVPEHKRNAIKPEDFADLYTEQRVRADIALVASREKLFQEDDRRNPELKERKRRAEMFEALLVQQIELENWFGQEASTIIPSRYDDIEKGVDLIVELESEGGFFKHLGLSIDATTHVPSIKRKIDNVRKDIQHGHLTTVKYFHSESRGFRGELKDIPRVVVGADANSVRELAGLWLNLNKVREQKTSLEKDLDKNHPEVMRLKQQIDLLRKRLAQHRIQFQVLEEIRAQLEYYVFLAQRQRQNTLVEKYQKALTTVNDIIREKDFELSPEESEKIKKDGVYKTILKEVLLD